MIMDNNAFKILIADDSLLNQEMLRVILASDNEENVKRGKMPYVLDSAKSGPEALVKAVDFKPDLILLDIIMPGLSGFEVIEKLQKDASARSIPVIIITGLSQEGYEEKGLECGAVDYITKPFRKAVVLARIKTQQKIVEQMRIIESHSLVDALTGISNRRNFDIRIEEQWGYARRKKLPVSVLMMDIDHFKKYNDTYGHQQGDETLKVVANSITGALMRSSDTAYRWGGEEFIALLVDTDLESAMVVGERIREGVETTAVPSVSGGDALSVTISVGVASAIPGDNNEIQAIIKQADMALYAAKESGRNRVCSASDAAGIQDE